MGYVPCCWHFIYYSRQQKSGKKTTMFTGFKEKCDSMKTRLHGKIFCYHVKLTKRLESPRLSVLSNAVCSFDNKRNSHMEDFEWFFLITKLVSNLFDSKIPIEEDIKLTKWNLAWSLAGAAEQMNCTHSGAIKKLELYTFLHLSHKSWDFDSTTVVSKMLLDVRQNWNDFARRWLRRRIFCWAFVWCMLTACLFLDMLIS